MSAKRVEGQRVWNIGPQFLHSAVAKGGTLAVHFERAEQVTRVRVNVTFPGPLKAEAEQAEIESRLTSMAHKMTQICGVTKPMVRCEVSPSGGAKVPCRHGP
ncbi:MAG: hypothetical protein HYV07_08190 [Deltaproteobacteria bacterium]|nr:hypothetical protein [Deltaproteobacteria bacterium]